jgi:sporulation protein YlmC with PRC-barrel domain
LNVSDLAGFENSCHQRGAEIYPAKIRGFIYSPPSGSHGIGHAARRLETKEFEFPAAISRSDWLGGGFMETGARQAPGAFTVVVKKSILGAKVINTEQEDLGKIEDLVIDARNSRVAYAILSFGGVLGLGDKHFAIPWEALTFDLSQKVAVLDMDKDRLKNAPGFDKDDWPDLANQTWGAEVYDYYGYRPYWQT